MARRILIIEDEKNICALLQDFLNDEGFQADVAYDLASGRTFLTNDKLPDLLILDVMLPDGNGFDYLKDLRSSPHTHALPIIMMSAHRVDVQDRVDGFDLGADDYMIKPFDLRELKSRIERLLKRVDRDHALAADVPARAPALIPEPPHTPARFEEVLKSVIEKKAPPRSSVITPQRGLPVRQEEKQRVPFLKSFRALLLEPKVFFQGWMEKNDGRIPFFALTLFSVGLGLQKGFEQKAPVMAFAVTAAALAAGLLCMFGGAWIFQWIQGLKGKRVPLLKTAESLGLIFGPLALSAVLGVVYVIGAGGRMGEFTAGPLLLMPSLDPDALVGFVLRHLDLFELWGLALAYRGARVVQEKSS